MGFLGHSAERLAAVVPLEVPYAEMNEQRYELVAGAGAVVTGVASCLSSIALGNGIDNSLVLLDRSHRPGTHAQSQHPGSMRLVHDGPSDARDAAIPATVDQGAVKDIVGFRPRRQIVVRESLAHSLVGLGKLADNGCPIDFRLARQKLGGHGFQRDDDGIDLAHVVGRDCTDQNPAASQHTDETFLLQADDGLVHGRTAHAEPGRNLLLGPLIAGREDILPNGVLQRPVGIVDE